MLLFKSIRSGSSGNLLLLESKSSHGRTRLLIDCGIRSQRACLQLLEEEVGLSEDIDALVVTHAHGDHVNYPSLRVLSRLGIPAFTHRQTKKQVLQRHLNPYRLPSGLSASDFALLTFDNEPFRIGAFQITPLPVPHAPGVTTHAFLIRHGHTRMMFASDFHDPEAIAPHMYNCDFVYLESNHDAELLRLHFNPASLYHLPNHTAGLLLQHAFSASHRLPRAVVLGHLSAERNRPQIAIATVEDLLDESGVREDVALIAAPRGDATETVVIKD